MTVRGGCGGEYQWFVTVGRDIQWQLHHLVAGAFEAEFLLLSQERETVGENAHGERAAELLAA